MVTSRHTFSLGDQNSSSIDHLLNRDWSQAMRLGLPGQGRKHNRGQKDGRVKEYSHAMRRQGDGQ